MEQGLEYGVYHLGMQNSYASATLTQSEQNYIAVNLIYEVQ